MENKERAKNNRTITLSENDRVAFEKNLINQEMLAEGTSFENKTIFGDTLEVLKYLPDGFADLIIADPPYNLTKKFGDTTFFMRSNQEYLEYLETWLPEVCRKLKKNGSLYLCGDWKCTSALQISLQKELSILNRITWQREKGRGAKANWKNGLEDIWYAVKDPKDYYFNLEAVKQKRKVLAPYKENGNPKDWKETESGNFRITCPSNFWDDISIPFWSMPENTDHPTQKPEKLYAKLILASCPPDGIVFDPFLGSGTASVTAKKLGRRYCGIEKDLDYCLLAEKRLSMADSDKTIQGYADGVFWERNSSPEKSRL